MASESRRIRLGPALAAIVALALALRVVGIGFGLPFLLVNDELPLIGGAMRMLELRNPVASLNPGPMSILYYPPGLPYLYLALFMPYLAVDWLAAGRPGLELFAERLLSDLSGPWLIARATTIAMGAGSAWVVARLGAQAFADRRAGLIAGLLVAVSFHQVMLGHFARVWVPTVFLFWWGIWAAWRVYEDGRRRDYVLAALAAGLSFAVNYVGVLSVVAIAIAHVARHRRPVVDREILLCAAIVAALVALFTALYWQNLVRLMGFSPMFTALPGVQQKGTPLPLASVAAHYADILWRADPTLAIGGALGLAWALARRPGITIAALCVCGAYLLVILTGAVDDDRYILPVAPLLALGAGGMLAALWRRWPRAGALAAAGRVLPPLAASAQLDRLMLADDTRVVARAWLLATAGEDEAIVSAMRAMTFEQTRDALAEQRAFEADGMSLAQRRKLAGRPVVAGGGGREVRALHAVRQTPDPDAPAKADAFYEQLRDAGYRWYVTDDLVDDPRRKVLDRVVRARGELVRRITPGPAGVGAPVFNLTNQFERARMTDVFRLERLGPDVEIWRLR